MAMPSLPPSVNPNKWKSLAKGDDPGNLQPLIDKLAKAHLGIDPKAFELPAFKDAAEAGKFSERLAAQAKGADAAAELVKELQKKGDKVLGDLKKDKAKAELAKLLTALLNEAPAYAKELRDTVGRTEKAVADAVAKLAEAQKKAEAAADSEGDAESDAMANEKDDKKFFENLKAKYKGFFNQLRSVGTKLKPAEAAITKAAQVKFRMVSQGKIFGLGMSKNSFGEGELKIARRMAGLTSGGKDSKGIAYWNSEDKVFVFEGASVPVGAANATALKIVLKQRLGYAPKIRLQKPGEKGEDSDGPAEEDPDFKNEAGGASPEEAQKTAQDLIARLEPLKAKLEQRLKAGGADADKLRQLEKMVREEAGRNPAKAKTAYDGLVLLLGAAPAAAAAPAAQAPAAAPAAATADALVPLPAFGSALKTWLDTRKRYAAEVKALAGSLESIYREELATKDPKVVKAIGEAKVKLTKTADLIGPECEQALGRVMQAGQRKAQQQAAVKAKAELDALAKKLMADPVFLSLEGKNNELKPDMKVVTEVTQALKSVQTAMADALKA
jgi:hypothetical protein